MTSAHYFRIQVPLFAGIVMVMIVACALLIPTFGLIGAAQATAIAALVQGLSCWGINSWIVNKMPIRNQS